MKAHSLFIDKSLIPNAGLGLFSNQFISKDTIVFVSFRKNGNHTGLFERDYDQTIRNSYVNHSLSPNLGSRWVNNNTVMIKYALRDIVQGEELTSNYADTKEIIAPLGYTLVIDFLWF